MLYFRKLSGYFPTLLLDEKEVNSANLCNATENKWTKDGDSMGCIEVDILKVELKVFSDLKHP